MTTQQLHDPPADVSQRITVDTELRGDRLEQAWNLYHTAFAGINALAVQRHLMYRHEFDDVMADERIAKYTTVDAAGLMTGLATYTNDLFAWTLISPEYFERRWPTQYAARTIFYCGFVAVDRHAGDATAFQRLVEAMYLDAARVNGLIVLDFCRRNDETHHMSRVIRVMLHRLSGGVRAERLDEQNFWMYEFPAVTS